MAWWSPLRQEENEKNTIITIRVRPLSKWFLDVLDCFLCTKSTLPLVQQVSAQTPPDLTEPSSWSVLDEVLSTRPQGVNGGITNLDLVIHEAICFTSHPLITKPLVGARWMKMILVSRGCFFLGADLGWVEWKVSSDNIACLLRLVVVVVTVTAIVIAIYSNSLGIATGIGIGIGISISIRISLM